MISATLTWNGPAVSSAVDSAISKSLFEGSAIIEGHAAANAPVKSGLLRLSYDSAVEGSANFPIDLDGGTKQVTAAKREAIIGTVVDYAPHVELGTRFQAAQPSLGSAFNSNVDPIKRLFRVNIRSIPWL